MSFNAENNTCLLQYLQTTYINCRSLIKDFCNILYDRVLNFADILFNFSI